MTSASLIIPTRGGAARLSVLFDALRHQSHTDWEAIVVIDGDIDDSAAVVERYGDLPLRAVVLPENRGRVSALNAGFEAAEGDVLIRCDDDFEPAPGHVAAHVAAHDERLCGAVGLPINIAPENAYMRVYGRDADERSRRDAYATAPDERWKLWGGNTSVRRETFAELGGFDTRYRGYGWEDVDFGYRLHSLGLPIELVPDAEVRHHMASVNTVARANRALMSGKARHTFDRLHGQGSSGSSLRALSSPWNAAVVAASRTMTPTTTPVIAEAVDRLIGPLPNSIGRKLVALTVEAAGASGYRSGQDRT